MFISIAMYPAIRSYDEQAFDNMSEESAKKNKKKLSLRNRCGLFQVKAWLSRPEKNGGLRSQDAFSDPIASEVAKDVPDKGYN